MVGLTKPPRDSRTFRLFAQLFSRELAVSLYQGLLERAPDSAGRDAYAEKLRKASDLTNVLSEIIRSDEFREKSIAALAPELVRAAFQGVLSQHSKGRTNALTGSSLGIFLLALDTTCRIPLRTGRESTGKQMNQAAASLVRIME